MFRGCSAWAVQHTKTQLARKPQKRALVDPSKQKPHPRVCLLSPAKKKGAGFSAPLFAAKRKRTRPMSKGPRRVFIHHGEPSLDDLRCGRKRRNQSENRSIGLRKSHPRPSILLDFRNACFEVGVLGRRWQKLAMALLHRGR